MSNYRRRRPRTPTESSAALAKHGIELFDDPSIVEGNAPVPITTFAGRVVAGRMLVRNAPQSAAVALPTADQIASLKTEFKAEGWSLDVGIVAIVVFSGGK